MTRGKLLESFWVFYKMAWFTYILECKDGSFYTGITWNLKKRVSEHNSRLKSCLQISKVPVRLVYWERFKDRFEAAKKEKVIKGWGRSKKIELIESLSRKSILGKESDKNSLRRV